MVKVELIKGLSYRGHGVSTIKGTPLTVNEEKAVVLVATGFFGYVGGNSAVLVPSQNAENNFADSLTPITTEDIEKMKTPQLIAFAEEKGIDVSSCRNNKERVKMIKDWLENQSGSGSGDVTAEDIDEMSELELLALAEQEGIDISTCATIEEYQTAIKAALDLGEV